MFLAERTVSVIFSRWKRTLCVGGIEKKNSQQGIVNEKDRQDKANDVGKGHIMQGFVGLVKEFGFIIWAMGSHRRILSWVITGFNEHFKQSLSALWSLDLGGGNFKVCRSSFWSIVLTTYYDT